MTDPFATLPAASPSLPEASVKSESAMRPASLTEARLLKSYYRDPRGGLYYRAKVRWMREYRDSSKWPKQVVTEQRMKLYQDWQTLVSLLEEPDEALTVRGWDGKKYWEMWLRSRSWLGRLHGLDEAIANRR